MPFKIEIGPQSGAPTALGKCPKCRARWLLFQAATKGAGKTFACHSCQSPIRNTSGWRILAVVSAMASLWVFRRYGFYNPLSFYWVFVIGLALFFTAFLLSKIELRSGFHDEA